jgi:CheY-like chemotaxis protein
MPNRTVHILLVEDDEVEAEQMMRSFEQMKISNPITHVTDGIEALQALRGEEGRERISRPYLILLDINLPRMTGLEFLEVLRGDDDLQQSIVFVLTTSDNESDKKEAYGKHVAGYFLKTRVWDEFLSLPQLIKGYWRMVEFPSGK